MGESAADTSHAGPTDPNQVLHGREPVSPPDGSEPPASDNSEPDARASGPEPDLASPGEPSVTAARPGESHGHVGEVVANRFRLVARIHTSSTGAVYRAEDLSLARPVALRLLTPILSRDTALLERLQDRLQTSMRMARDEVRVLGDIVDLIDLGRSDSGQVFVVTDFIHGENLAEQVSREGPLPWTAIRPLMVRACQILHLSHEHGVVRLDLQTRHLFPVRDKTQSSTLKILSPGLQLDPALSPEMIRYAAPEQITRAACDRRTDIYALGVIMYELLTGQVPFADAVPAVILARHLLEPPPPLPMHLRDQVPPAVLAIVHRALAKQPAERWPTMKAMANAMAAIDFGPCDVSGMLEVVDGEPVLPSTSSASMHIDPAASHGASTPAVRPRTFPPLQDAFSDGAAYAPSEPSALTVVPEPSALTRPPAESFASAPDPDASSRMAWEEILAAAEEAITIVASAEHGSGTAGDSGVFIPESLLRSGGAASASQVHGRRLAMRPEPSLAETVVLPMSLIRADAPTEPTMQLGPEDFMGSSASLSAARLPLGPEDVITTASYPVVPRSPPPLPIDERITTAYPTVAAAVSAALKTSAAPTSESAPLTRSGEHVDDSTTTLRVHKAERPLGVWPREAPRERSPWLAWAAGLLLLVGGGLTVARLTGSPTNDLADRTAANRTARRAEPAARPALPASDLSPGTSPAADPNLPSRTGPGAPTDLAPGTAAPIDPRTPTAVVAAPPLPGSPGDPGNPLPGSPSTAPATALLPDSLGKAPATSPLPGSPDNPSAPRSGSPDNPPAATSSSAAASSSRHDLPPTTPAAAPRNAGRNASSSTATGPRNAATRSNAAAPPSAAASTAPASNAAAPATAPSAGSPGSPAPSPVASATPASPGTASAPGASTAPPGPSAAPPGSPAAAAPATPASPPAATTSPAAAPPASDLAPGTAPGAPPTAAPGASNTPAHPGPDLSAKTAPPAAPAPQANPAPASKSPPAPVGGHDPLLAARLLQSAEQSAARGQHSQALGLATQSFNAAPTARSLQVAGEAACRLGNAVKAKWARQHLAAGDRKPIEAACAAAGVVLD